MHHNQVYGNLLSYKFYTRPTARRTYGYTHVTKVKHQKNVHELLNILFMHGTSSTWEMAQTKYSKVTAIRNQEKIYRRLLVGRTDRNKYSRGILDIGLVLKEGSTRYTKYRLSLYGILYCLDTQELDKKSINNMAKKYAFLLPNVFGKWNRIKSVLGSDVYNLEILAKGVLLNNTKFAHNDNPLYELMSYLHIKYRRNFESIYEHRLAEQISYWFYTYLLYTNPQKLSRVLAKDSELQQWYVDFFNEARNYYAQRLLAVKNFNVLGNNSRSNKLKKTITRT